MAFSRNRKVGRTDPQGSARRINDPPSASGSADQGIVNWGPDPDDVQCSKACLVRGLVSHSTALGVRSGHRNSITPQLRMAAVARSGHSATDTSLLAHQVYTARRPQFPRTADFAGSASFRMLSV